MVRQIPLRNKHKEIVDCALVSDEDFDRVNKYKWHRVFSHNKKYVFGYIDKDNQSVALHHFLIGKPIKGMVTDHINSNGLDNRRENLRHVTHGLNSQNKENIPSAHTIYRGVSFVKKVNRWRSAGSDTHIGHYLTDIEAARAYDRFILMKHGQGARTNGLVSWEEVKEMTLEDVLAHKRKKELPKNISRFKEYFRVRFTYDKREKTVGYCKTLKEAEQMLEKYKREVIQPQIDEKHNNHKTREITRNNLGEAIIIVKNKNGSLLECIVDDDQWHHLSQFTWSYNRDKYVFSYIDGKRISMHKHLLQVDEDNKVDHINQKPFDNRKCNLRKATSSQNSHNSTKRAGASSKYQGVSWHKASKKWMAYISKDVRYHLGLFVVEADAARAYNAKAIELYGDHANLNVIQE